MSKMGLTGPKSRCQQGWAPPGGSQRSFSILKANSDCLLLPHSDTHSPASLFHSLGPLGLPCAHLCNPG